ncbi:MAG: Xylose isomerase domain protein barrel [Paenibacillus sp.]|uniref:Sugar phosphate isomerase/epimerase n=1 Tax=Paenibacillus hemerocallicola TaxID=1172614 RepID=A0A5C4SW98_9BACL|nr:sugar phosphate isomerase/epimerase family protein [Paenibacillus hemerocallicola]MDF2661693.1 Xylose isomerase domain protein barrel [Paenibacillus sp.]TNJ55776.1 sugar phosphate isomerase/epimerase [Paenibacillus hemerocallicola]
MKKGINQWSFPADMSAAACIRLAKQAGFDGIELALAETGDLSLESSPEQVAELARIAEGEGVEISSLASGLGWSYALTSTSKQNRDKAIDVVKRQLDVAAQLKADTILVLPGAVGVDFIPGSAVTEYDVAYDNALEALRLLSSAAAAARVSIGVENVWNKFLLSPLEMRTFIDSIGSDYVGAYLDVGNTILTGYPEHWIKILNSRIKKVHFKDFRRNGAGLSAFVDLLAGDVDYPLVMRKLQEIGYSDYVIAEMIPPYRHYPEQIIYNTSGAMDAILGRTGRRAE